MLKYLNVLFVILSICLSIGQAVQAQSTTLPKISIDKTIYSYSIRSNADSIEYSLWLDSKEQFKQRLALNNPESAVKVANLDLKFTKPGIYQLKFKLLDDVLNSSPIYTQVIQYTAPKKIPREKVPPNKEVAVLGESTASESNLSTANTSSSGKLIINRIEKSHHWENISINAPLLTEFRQDGKNYILIGSSIRTSDFILLEVYELVPSFAQAIKICTGSEASLLKAIIINDSEVGCVSSVMEVTSLDTFFKQIKECTLRLLPWEIYNCQRNQIHKREQHYRGNRKYPIANAHIKFFQQLESEAKFLDYTLITDDQTFQKQLAVNADAQVFSRVEMAGILTYEDLDIYYLWQSPRSNTLQANLVGKQNLCSGKDCKILDVAYFNQAVSAKGVWENWPGWPQVAGGQACGAASSVIVANFFGKLPKQYSLKSFVFADNGQPLSNKKCDRGGAFAVTAYDSACNQSSLVGINNYLNTYRLKLKVHWASSTDIRNSSLMGLIRKAIDQGRPLIISYKTPIRHLLVIKGYISDTLLIVNDPYRDIQNNYRKGRYDYSGEGAIYQLQPRGFTINYIAEVYE